MNHTVDVEDTGSDSPSHVDDMRPVVVGRADELARLTELADRSVEEGARIVFVSGEAGIGKSTLIKRFSDDLADARWAVHTGHCIEYADRTLPFGPIVTIIRSLLTSLAEDADDVIGRHRADVAALLPELEPSGVDSASLTGDVDRLIDAISTVLIRAAEHRPMVLIIEDIHWADAATRDLISSVVHSLGTSRILMIVSERTGAVARGRAFHTWLAELRRFPNVETIGLEGLTRSALAEQAAAILGHEVDDAALSELEARTAGNAYFAHELLHARRAGTTELPRSLADFLLSRTQRLTGDEQRVLQAMAVAGRPVSHRTLSEVLPDLDMGSLTRQLYDASFIVIDGSDLAFGHALMREAILRNMLPFETEDLHRKLAEHIAATIGRTSSPADLATLALHWKGANDQTRTIAAAVHAAAAAAGVAAFDSAADLARLAIDLWARVDDPEDATGTTRDRLTVAASDWLVGSNRSREAAELLQDAISTIGHTLSDGRRALLLAKLAPIQFDMGRPTEAKDLMAAAVTLVGDEVSAEAAEVHHRSSKLSVVVGQIHPAIEAAERAISIAERCGPDVVLVEALTTKALGLGVTDSLQRGVELVQEARRRAVAQNMTSQVASTFRTEMMILNYRVGRTPESLTVLRDGLTYAEQHCGPSLRLDIQLDLALGLVESGRLVEAAPVITQLLKTPFESLRGLVILQSAGLHGLLAGDLDGAAEHLAAANALSRDFRSAQETGFQHRLEAELARRQGRFDDAEALIDRALELQLASDNITFTRESILEKCRLARAVAAEDIDRASRMRTDVGQLVAHLASQDPASAALTELMRLELRTIDNTATSVQARAVIDVLESYGFGADILQATLTRAQLLADEHLAAGTPKSSGRMVDTLVELRELGTSSGMLWLCEGADRITEQLGMAIDLTEEVEASEASSEPAHGLTAREVEVLALLAEGMTNKEIGAELYVSHRTISTHVSNLLAKLHLKNRSEAAAAYHRLGFAPADR